MDDLAKKADLPFKIIVVCLLALIAYQQSREITGIAYSSLPDVQKVRIVNTDKDRIPVDAQLPKIGNGILDDSIPVRITNGALNPVFVSPIR